MFIGSDLLASVDHPWNAPESNDVSNDVVAGHINEAKVAAHRSVFHWSRAVSAVVVMVVVALITLLLFSPPTPDSAQAAPTAQAPVREALLTPARFGESDQTESSFKVPFENLYRDAASEYGVAWRVVAAIAAVETRHGHTEAPGVWAGLNYAECCAGVTQFCVVESCGNTFAEYGVDGDKDGAVSVYDREDAVFSTANYLVALEEIVGSDPVLLMASYNAGPGAVMEYEGVPPYAETQDYVARGEDLIRSWKRK